jgi:hypothetical protein
VTWIDGKNVVVADGRCGDPFDSVSWPLAMSDDGRVVTYAARAGDDHFCVTGATRSRPYRAAGLPSVSADGQVVALAASDGRKWFAVVNGREGPPFEWVGHVVAHARGAAYVAERERGRFSLVVDDRPGPVYDRITRPAISADGRVVACGARRAGRWFLVVGDRETPVEGEIDSVFLSGDGSRAGCVLEEERSFRIGRGPRFDWIGWPAFAPDGRAVCLARRGEARFLVVDGQSMEIGNEPVWDLVLSPDGTHVGFGARAGRALRWEVRPLPEVGSPTSRKERQP